MNKITPNHYKGKYDCIHFVKHMSFPLGNAFKYVWRAGSKDGESAADDLQKAEWYLRNHESNRYCTVAKYVEDELFNHLAVCGHDGKRHATLALILMMDLHGKGNIDDIVEAVHGLDI